MLNKGIKTKFNQFVNFKEFQLNVETTEKQSTKQSSQSIDLIKKIVVKKTSQEIIAEIECYKPVSKFIDMNELRQKSNVQSKRYRECIYFGEIAESKKQGSGIMIYTNGRIYEGQWKNNFKQGQGYERFVNLASYSGAYRKGKPHGYGRYEWQNGENYEGQWMDGVKCGSGIWRGAQGDSYIGEWKDDKAEGYGVHTWVNGNRYEGQFRQCLKHGEGIQKFANGDTYKGYYENGKPHGEGEYFWNDGSSYKGEFSQGLRCGKGIWRKSTHPSADTYEGEYKNEKKQGYGVFIWSNGSKYIGNFVEDLRNGYGEMYWGDGTVYKGEWRNGEQVEQIQIQEQQQSIQQQQNSLNTDFIHITQQFQRVSTPHHNKRSKSKIDQSELIISNPQQSLDFFPISQQKEPEIIELKKFRARELASRSKSRMLERSMINVDGGFFVDRNNNFFNFNDCISSSCGNHVGKDLRKMQKKSSRLSFNTTKSPYLIQTPQKGRIKHSQSTTEGRPLSVCFYSRSKTNNKSAKNIPIKNFQGVELTQDHFDKPSMVQSRAHSRTKTRMIKSSNGVRNVSHRPQSFEVFWQQKPARNSSHKMNTNEQIKWFTRSKNELKYY